MEKEDSERRLAAIMFTDIVGYSALAQTDEALSLKVLKKHNQLLRPFFSKYRGREVKTIGDSFLVQFASALDAVDCATKVQEFLHEYNVASTEDWGIKLRIGIHLGDVVHESNDIFGDAVNIASRIQPLADPEGVCISQQVFDQVHNKIKYPMELLDHPDLKNVSFQTNAYCVLMPWQQEKPTSARLRGTEDLDRTRVAVLPFANLSPDPGDDYFADGMTEELVTALNSIKELRVIARTSVMKYKNSDKRIKEIAEELNVGTILAGSIRKAGKRLRVSIQLIDARSEEHIIARSFDREFQDIFAIQSEIAQTVAESLSVHFRSSERKLLDSRTTSNMEAYSLYLKGRVLWDTRNEASIKAAMSYFEQATKEDPSYAPAYSGLADCLIIQGVFGFQAPDVVFPKAEFLVKKALEINPNLAEAHASLGDLLMHHLHDWTNAEKELKRAISIKPNYATAHHWYSEYLAIMGRIEEAIEEENCALGLDPFSLITRNMRATYLYCARRYREAEEACKGTLEVERNHSLTIIRLAKVHALMEEYGLAISEAQKAVELSGGSLFIKGDLGYIHARAGNAPRARQILEELKEELSKNEKYVPPYGLAIICLGLGERDEALDWLEKAYNQANTVEFVKTDPVFDVVRSDPRFINILKKMKLLSDQEASQAQIEAQRMENAQKMAHRLRRIAVLPFSNTSPDSADDYFADGMTEELISTLSKAGDLKVIARTSIIGYKGTNKKINEIATELGADSILEGSVRKAGDKLRITVQLVDSRSGEYIWTETYDRNFQDIFVIQSDIAKNVAQALSVRLLTMGAQRSKSTESTEAYSHYLKGRYFWNQRELDGFNKAIKEFEAAIEKDPIYASAYAGLADTHLLLGRNGHVAPRFAYPKAIENAKKAISLDSRLPDPHVTLAAIKQEYEWKWEEANREFKSAIALNPSNTIAHSWYALCLGHLGRIDEGIAEANLAQELDPLSPRAHCAASEEYLFARDYDASIEAAEKAMEISPNFTYALVCRAYARVEKKMYDEAIEDFQEAQKQFGARAVMGRLGHAYAVSGRKSEATEILKELTSESRKVPPRSPFIPPPPDTAFDIGLVYLGLGEREKTIEWLDRAIEEKTAEVIHFKCEPIYDWIRNDPDFRALVKKIGLEDA